MKKILVIMLVMVLALSAFAGCTPKADDSTTSTDASEGSEELIVVKMGLAMQSKQAPAFHAWEDY